MNISLTPELVELVRGKVESGLYNNHSEVIRKPLRLLSEQDRLRESHVTVLQQALVEGLARADRGELRDGPSVVAKLRGVLERRLSSPR